MSRQQSCGVKDNVSITLKDGRILDFTRPLLMGVVNLNSQSLASIGRQLNISQAVDYITKLAESGADIVDIGAEPTNPEVKDGISEEQELNSLIPLISILSNTLPVTISVDTSRPKVMEAAIAAGAHIINDVRALREPGALEMAAQLDVPVCLMHMRNLTLAGTTTVIDTTLSQGYSILEELKLFFDQRLEDAKQAGIKPEKIILDPGLGSGNFGKNKKETLLLLKNLAALKSYHRPLLVGVSRKTFISEVLNVPVDQRFTGGLVASLIAIQNGANIIRVHDVKYMAQAMTMLQAIEQA